MYLRCFIGDKLKSWVEWLPWAEFCYNTSFHTTLKTFPFQVIYGCAPPRLLSYTLCSSRVEAVDQALLNREMMEHCEKGHRDVTFEPATWALLCLYPFHQLSVSKQQGNKFLPKYYGPFQILKRIDDVAYPLALPPISKVHDVFHASLLKHFKGSPPSTMPTSSTLHDGHVVSKPQQILKARINRGEWEILVHWSSLTIDDSTWEPLSHFHSTYPDFTLEEKLFVQEESDNNGKTTERRKALHI
ncbi:hypothetical protein MANES_04G056666v8 [Manihot esculenta]|uniref:Uncharacterized protein n=1 Tax=Manihot esculenta TaxID=3983 RepID=A0ACB7HTD7_MANES|nr:hypothetical protein MANES_04G056666v8 [Manihot esculenta]